MPPSPHESFGWAKTVTDPRLRGAIVDRLAFNDTLIETGSDAQLPLLQGIERTAGRCFRDIGMPEIADDEPLLLPRPAREALSPQPDAT